MKQPFPSLRQAPRLRKVQPLVPDGIHCKRCGWDSKPVLHVLSVNHYLLRTKNPCRLDSFPNLWSNVRGECILDPRDNISLCPLKVLVGTCGSAPSLYSHTDGSCCITVRFNVCHLGQTRVHDSRPHSHVQLLASYFELCRESLTFIELYWIISACIGKYDMLYSSWIWNEVLGPRGPNIDYVT